MPRRITKTRALQAAVSALEWPPVAGRFPNATRRVRDRLQRWMLLSPDRLHNFWRQPPQGQKPEDFIVPTERSDALVTLISDLPKSASILEVGCNVGRNLACLHELGYENLAGIEINADAVELLRSTYPALSEIPVYVGPAEDVLPPMAADSFDLVFTMGVIMAIHPDHSAVFDHMARVGKSILTIEPAGDSSHTYYPHDVPALFTSRGFALTSTVRMEEFPERHGAWKGFLAHRFVRAATS